MKQNLYTQVAKKILAESLRIRKGETVTIESWNNGLPFAREVTRQARRIGSIPITLFEDETAYVNGVRNTPKEILGRMGKHEYAMLSGTDAYVFIPGPPLATFSRKITRQEVIDSTRYNSSWYEAAKKARLKGVRMTFGYIGDDMASILGKKVPEIIEHQLGASLVDFKAISRKAIQVAKQLKEGARATLTHAGTKLEFDLKGEVDVQDGVTSERDVEEGNNVAYVPPGYIEKEVDRTSVSGKLRLSTCLTRFGLLEDAVLEFEEGRLTKWTSRRSADVFAKLGEVIPEKNRVMASIIIGLNRALRFGYGQDRFPAGALSVIAGFTGIIRRGSLTVGGKALVKDGRLL